MQRGFVSKTMNVATSVAISATMGAAKGVTARVGLSLVLLASAVPARAVLDPGDIAPDFKADAALAGTPFKFDLGEALKSGPVVLYFYPKAFTSGCTVEAHLFAQASEQFKALGARVVGVSRDDLETLKKFSVSECRNQFAVAADPDGDITASYEARLWYMPMLSDRVSYVITPDRKVLHVHADMSPDQHVASTLRALREWKARQR